MVDLIRNTIYRVKNNKRVGGETFKKDERYIFWVEEFIPYDFCTLFVFVKPPKPDKSDWNKKGAFDIPPRASYILCRFSHNQDGSKSHNSETFNFLEQTSYEPLSQINLPPRILTWF